MGRATLPCAHVLSVAISSACCRPAGGGETQVKWSTHTNTAPPQSQGHTKGSSHKRKGGCAVGSWEPAAYPQRQHAAYKARCSPCSLRQPCMPCQHRRVQLVAQHVPCCMHAVRTRSGMDDSSCMDDCSTLGLPNCLPMDAAALGCWSACRDALRSRALSPVLLLPPWPRHGAARRKLVPQGPEPSEPC